MQGRLKGIRGLRRNYKMRPWMCMSKYIKYIVKTVYLKLIFLAFWDAKLFIKFLNSKFSRKEAIVREFDCKPSSKKQKSLIAAGLISICKLQ